MPPGFNPAAGAKGGSSRGSSKGRYRRKSFDSYDSKESESGDTYHGIGYAAKGPTLDPPSDDDSTQSSYIIFSRAWTRTVEVTVWLRERSNTMLYSLITNIVCLVVLLWVSIEVCHKISILGFLSSFLSKGALGDFIQNADLNTVCPAYPSHM
jgi:hypothetical protein